MTIKELIEKLSTFPQDAKVDIDVYVENTRSYYNYTNIEIEYAKSANLLTLSAEYK